MYDINVKNVKKGSKFYYIFLGCGIFNLLLFGVFGVSTIVELSKLDSKTLSISVNVKSHYDDEGNKMYSPIYYYEVDGQQYSCRSSASSSKNPGTQNKTVYYDSKNPSNCMNEYSKSSNFIIMLIFLILSVPLIIIGVINIKKVNKRVKVIKELNQTGKLVKNLPYRLGNTGMTVNNVPIKRPVVDYTLSSGSTITLYGDPRHDRKYYDADGMVDLLIDENNPDNYFIDFEINRLSGNLPQDYYIQNNQNNSVYSSSSEQPIHNQEQTQYNNQNPNINN